jgi:hypothetical protein
MAFKIKKHVTLPLFKLDSTPRYLRFEGAVYIGKVVEDKKEPPHLAKVTDMETGEMGEVILGTVLLGNLNEHYPEDKYVGKIFCLTKTSPEGSRKYSLYNITEVEEEAKEVETVEQIGDKKKAESKKAA